MDLQSATRFIRTVQDLVHHEPDMSDIDELRRQFFEDDDNDPYTFATVSGSGVGPRGRGSGSANVASSSTALGTSSPRMQPYPRRTGRSSNEGASGSESLSRSAGRSSVEKTRKNGKAGETPFMARLRAARNDEDDVGMQGQRATDSDATIVGAASDAMDVDGPRSMVGNRGSSRRDDVQKLLRAWQNERHSPDVLPTCDDLLSRILDSIHQQLNVVNTLSNEDVTLSDEDHCRITLVQIEVERIRFVVRSYIRTRLFKIEKYASYISLNQSVHTRLTKAELDHALRYAKLVVTQFNTTVLNHVPETQSHLDDDATPPIPSMLTEPDKSKPVFFHAFGPIEGLQLDDGTTGSIIKDAIILVPYRVIEQPLLRGEGELV